MPTASSATGSDRSSVGAENFSDRLVAEDALRCLVRRKQGFEAGAQCLFLSALAVEPRGALGGWLHEQASEQGLFVRGSHGIRCVGTLPVK